VSGGEKIPISQANTSFDNQQLTVYMSPSSLNTFINDNIVPVGTIWPYAGIVNNTNKPLPYGWLFCDGSELFTTTYADLYSVIGEIYGTPSQVGKFKLPDMRCRFVMGYNSATTTYKPNFGKFTGPPISLGQLSGVFTHTLSLPEMVAHTHECTTTRSYIPLLKHPGSQVEQYQEDDGDDRTYSGNIFPTIDLSASYVGGSMYHNTTPPYVAMHYIIKY
jgi:microcystin-dependent protein